MAVDSGHYPYKYDEAVSAGMPVELAEANRDAVNAQHDYHEELTSDNYAAWQKAIAALQALRAAERVGREGTMVVIDNGSSV